MPRTFFPDAQVSRASLAHAVDDEMSDATNPDQIDEYKYAELSSKAAVAFNHVRALMLFMHVDDDVVDSYNKLQEWFDALPHFAVNDSDTDAESDAERKAEVQGKRDDEAQEKRDDEAKAKAKRDAEAKAKAKRDAEAKAKRDAEAKAKRDAEAKAKSKRDAEAKAKAKRDAEAKAKSKAKLDVEANAKPSPERKPKPSAKLSDDVPQHAEPHLMRGYIVAEENWTLADVERVTNVKQAKLRSLNRRFGLTKDCVCRPDSGKRVFGALKKNTVVRLTSKYSDEAAAVNAAQAELVSDDDEDEDDNDGHDSKELKSMIALAEQQAKQIEALKKAINRKREHVDEKKFKKNKRPRGRAPAGKTWDAEEGKFV